MAHTIKWVQTGKCKDCKPTLQQIQNRRACHGCWKVYDKSDQDEAEAVKIQYKHVRSKPNSKSRKMCVAEIIDHYNEGR
ncbi:MAG TPA: hypothetical protein VEF53_19040 [Patescibacteria group bacterium]|nr:hypothetical protein [Patescibacteria group bacterium]